MYNHRDKESGQKKGKIILNWAEAAMLKSSSSNNKKLSIRDAPVPFIDACRLPFHNTVRLKIASKTLQKYNKNDNI